MAGDWIKMEVTLRDKPEVIRIAAALNLDPDTVVGKLHRIWSWADQHTNDGHAVGVTLAFLSHAVSVTDFAETMVKVGWLVYENDILTFPNFDRHNGQSAKKRALASKRKRNSRSRFCHADVTLHAGPEKRREDIIHSLKKESVLGESSPPPSVQAVLSIVGEGTKIPRQLYGKLIEALGENPNLDILRLNYASWLERGYNGKSFIWATEWYRNGIPEKGRAANGAKREVGQAQAVPGKYGSVSKH